MNDTIEKAREQLKQLGEVLDERKREVDGLRDQWNGARLRLAELVKQVCPEPSELLFAARARCRCGAGLAYRPEADPDSWECSDVLMGRAGADETHDEAKPFAFYEIKSEDQPSAKGATTRSKAQPE